MRIEFPEVLRDVGNNPSRYTRYVDAKTKLTG